jgi:hypothetical protein
MSGEESKEQKKGIMAKTGKLYFFLNDGSKLEFSKVTRLILKHFRAKQYHQLSKEINDAQLAPPQLREFFLAEGRTLLNWAINSVSSAESLQLLCRVFDKQTLQEILLSSKLSILQKFLMTDAGLLRMGLGEDMEAKNSQFEKFRLLLQIDFKEVHRFMISKISSKDLHLTARAKTSFEAALARSYADAKTELVKASHSSEAKRVKLDSAPESATAISLAPPIVSFAAPQIDAPATGQQQGHSDLPPSPHNVHPAK